MQKKTPVVINAVIWKTAISDLYIAHRGVHRAADELDESRPQGN
jgi:hypothetical protein